MQESSLEQGLRRWVRKCGGRVYKFVCPGYSGVADRICVFPGGKIIFVEVKRPGLKDGRSIRQKKFAKDMTALGCIVWRINDLHDFKERLARKGVKPIEV